MVTLASTPIAPLFVPGSRPDRFAKAASGRPISTRAARAIKASTSPSFAALVSKLLPKWITGR